MTFFIPYQTKLCELFFFNHSFLLSGMNEDVKNELKVERQLLVRNVIEGEDKTKTEDEENRLLLLIKTETREMVILILSCYVAFFKH